jgi:hypothetical protein
MRNHSVSPLRSAWAIVTPGVRFLDLLTRGDEVVPGRDGRGVHARVLVEVAAVEHHHRTRVPGHGVDRVAGHQFGALELGELRRDGVVIAQGREIDEAVGELGPEDLGLLVLDRDDVRQVGASGGTTCEGPVQDLLVAQVLHRHGHARVLLHEALGDSLQGSCSDIPAPDRDLAREVLGLGCARREAKRQRSHGSGSQHVGFLPLLLPVFGAFPNLAPQRASV